MATDAIHSLRTIRRETVKTLAFIFIGDIESMALLAGQTVGLVKEIKSAATIVRELADEATRLIELRLSVIASG
jgi:hypothetical protein